LAHASSQASPQFLEAPAFNFVERGAGLFLVEACKLFPEPTMVVAIE
jgi:hypothetical protein